MTKLTYAIGDIHGQLALLKAAHEAIVQDAAGKDYEIVHIGDYIDRGPHSAQVIDYLTEAKEGGAPLIFLRGNHDRMMRYALNDPPEADPRLRKELFWLHARLGGLTTVASYGVKTPRVVKEKDVPKLLVEFAQTVSEKHLDFLDNLLNSYETDQCFFAHAGVNPERALNDQVEDDLIWIRDPFLKHEEPFEKLIVHGHTPAERLEHSGNRVNIDTGAAYGYPLSTIVIEGDAVFEITPEGRKALPSGV